MTDQQAPDVTLGPARPPTNELSNALWGVLTQAELGGEAPFETRDLCLLAAVAAVAGGEKTPVPPEFSAVLQAAFAELGLPSEPSVEAIQKAIGAELARRPVDDVLLATLEGFRTGPLAASLQQARSEQSANLLGRSSVTPRARNVNDKPQMTAQQLMNKRHPGKTIIR